MTKTNKHQRKSYRIRSVNITLGGEEKFDRLKMATGCSRQQRRHSLLHIHHITTSDHTTYHTSYTAVQCWQDTQMAQVETTLKQVHYHSSVPLTTYIHASNITRQPASLIQLLGWHVCMYHCEFKKSNNDIIHS